MSITSTSLRAKPRMCRLRRASMYAATFANTRKNGSPNHEGCAGFIWNSGMKSAHGEQFVIHHGPERATDLQIFTAHPHHPKDAASCELFLGPPHAILRCPAFGLRPVRPWKEVAAPKSQFSSCQLAWSGRPAEGPNWNLNCIILSPCELGQTLRGPDFIAIKLTLGVPSKKAPSIKSRNYNVTL